MARPAAAEPTPLRWREHEQIASRLSDWMVVGQLTASVIASSRSDRPWASLGCMGIQTGVAIGINELLKRVIDRPRPDGSDNKSMPSMHTAIGAANSGWYRPVSLSLTVSIAIGRQAAHKHYPSDTLVGGVIGFVSQKVCDR